MLKQSIGSPGCAVVPTYKTSKKISVVILPIAEYDLYAPQIGCMSTNHIVDPYPLLNTTCFSLRFPHGK